MKKEFETMQTGDFVRNFAIDAEDIAAIDTEQRTVTLSFSSAAEIERWGDIEVLDHGAGAIRLERLRQSAPLLYNHDWDKQIGVIESVQIDAAQGKGRAVVRFSQSNFADEIFRDVQDGIRKNVSVGYRVHDFKRIEQRGDTDVFLVTDWEPYEISIVSVPADTSVGVGRSYEKLHNETADDNADNAVIDDAKQSMQRMKFDFFTDENGNYCRQPLNDNGERVGTVEIVRAAEDTAEHGAAAEHKRVNDLLAMGERYGASDLARQFIAERKSAAELQTAILERMENKPGKPLAEQRDVNIGLTEREAKEFSLMRAVRAMLPNASRADIEAAKFEFECSQAAQRQYGREAQGILVPADVLNRAFNVGAAHAGSGGALVATDLRADMFVEMLRHSSTIMRLGYLLDGLVGDVDIPSQDSGSSGYWVGEDEDVTASDLATSVRKLSPKTVGARVEITRRLLRQSTPSAERLVWDDIKQCLALKIDEAAYYGTGTDNQPKGLSKIDGLNAVTFAAANPNFAELVKMESEIAADNADVSSMAYVFNASMRGHLKTTPKFGSGTESTIWESGNTVNGYRTEVSNQIKAGEVFFGNFKDLIIALWGGLDITVDPYSLSAKGGLRIVAFQDVDFMLRHTASICYGKMAG